MTRRYFASHGPATVRDFVWWSGLTTTDAKRGLEIIRARQDEYLVAYRDRAAVPPATLPRVSAVTFQHALVIDGQVAGTWRMKDLAMTITPVRRLTGRERQVLRDAASRYERFLDVRLKPDATI